MTAASESRLFGSVFRALDFYPEGPGSNPTIGAKFFQLCFIPLLRLSCHKSINTIYQFIKPFIDNKKPLFEKYGVFNIINDS